MFQEVFVGQDEVVVTQKASVSTERGGVGTLQYEVFLRIDECRLFTSECAPEHKDNVLSLVADGFDGGIGEKLPAGAFVASGLIPFNGEHGVK